MKPYQELILLIAITIVFAVVIAVYIYGISGWL